MSKMPWIRFFPSDWLAGTRGMSAVETGVYITLIATMYERRRGRAARGALICTQELQDSVKSRALSREGMHLLERPGYFVPWNSRLPNEAANQLINKGRCS